MKRIFKNGNFIKLFFAQNFEQIGDSFMLMALIAWVMTMKENGSSSANMSILMFWIGLPIVLFGPFAGVFIDRYKKKHVLFFSAISRCICIFLIFLLVGNKQTAPLIFFLVFIKSIISQFFIPARSSMIPHIVNEKDLLDANSISAASLIVCQIITYALAGIVIAEIGFKEAFLINGIIYLIVVIMIIFINDNESLSYKNNIKIKIIINEFNDGLKYLISSEKLLFYIRRIFFFLIAVGFIYVALTGSFLSSVINETGLKIKEIKALGFIQGFLGLGLIIGILIVNHALKFFREQELIRVLYPIIGIFIITIFFWRDFYYLLLIAIFGGTAGIMILSIAETEIQKNTTSEIRGRIFSVYYILRGIGVAAAASLTGVVAKIIKEDQIILICGISLFIYGMISFFIKRGYKIGRDKKTAS